MSAPIATPTWRPATAGRLRVYGHCALALAAVLLIGGLLALTWHAPAPGEAASLMAVLAALTLGLAVVSMPVLLAVGALCTLIAWAFQPSRWRSACLTIMAQTALLSLWWWVIAASC